MHVQDHWHAPLLAAALTAVLVLAGCASHPHGGGGGRSGSQGGGYYQNDGPPDDQNIDLSKVPDAVPKNAPLSTYGNPDSYTALGHTYYVMKNAAGFTQTGYASWYGRQFHGKRTSSGEPYNMFRMTAAHKRLPLPTWVRVTNLDNGLHCIVKVNDRGPFHKGRIIDLSYAAARRLKIVGNGSAPVRIETVTPASMHEPDTAPAPQRPRAPLRSAANPSQQAAAPTQPPATNTPPTSAGAMPTSAPVNGLYLQAGAFASSANANRLAQRLSGAGVSHVKIVPPSHGATLYRVRIGPFSSASQRERTQQTLASHGFTARDLE